MDRRLLLLLLGACFVTVGNPVRGQELDETGQSAAWLLRKATLPHRDGGHNVLLRSLRQLRDPALEPFFDALTRHEQPAMKFHGVLGLAEIARPPRLDLARVANIADPLTQAQIIGSAIESDLMDLTQCEQVLQSPGYDAAIRIIVATRLVAKGKLKDLSPVQDAAESDKLAMRGMLALLKLQAGDRSAIEALRTIDIDADPSRDEVRAMLLQTAFRNDFDAASAWAMEIASRDAEDKKLAFLALRSALHFNVPGAVGLWKQRLQQAADNPADRIRLALLALDVAERLEPAAFDALAADPDPLLGQIARTGRAVAADNAPEQEIMKLVELNHALSSQWALGHAQRMPADRGRAVLIAFILSAEGEPNPPANRALRIENCVFATQHLLENDPESHPVLAGILRDAPALTREAMLMGLLKSGTDAPHTLIEGVSFPTAVGESIAILIRGRYRNELDAASLDRLSLMVRGGAGLKEPLRVQAGWVYLKLTGQTGPALANVFKG